MLRRLREREQGCREQTEQWAAGDWVHRRKIMYATETGVPGRNRFYRRENDSTAGDSNSSTIRTTQQAGQTQGYRITMCTSTPTADLVPIPMAPSRGTRWQMSSAY